MFDAFKPFLGWGFETSKLDTLRSGVFTQDSFVMSAHDDYLQVLVETGLAGFACVVWFIVLLDRNGLRRFDVPTKFGGYSSGSHGGVRESSYITYSISICKSLQMQRCSRSSVL